MMFSARFRSAGARCAGAALLLLPAVATWRIPLATAQTDEPSGLAAAAAIEQAMISAIARAERSVVAIARVRRNDSDHVLDAPDVFGRAGRIAPRPGDPEFVPNEYATGVVVGADGLILTAHHVLRENCDYWITTPDRKTYKVARILGADPRSDLAVLAIEARDLVPIKFGDGTKLRKGQVVIALGNPYAIARDGEASASWGIVANVARKDGPWPGREGQPTKPTLHHYGTLIQTDARLNLGTSGGALVNLQGEMVGLTVALAAALGYEQPAGFALRVDETFRRAVETLKQGGEVEYGFLGISLPPAFDLRSRVRPGVTVAGVLDGTPAGRSALRKDDLITHVNGHPVRDHDELLLYVGRLPPTSGVELTVERDGRPQTVTVRELSKSAATGRLVVTSPPPAWRGLQIDYVTASPNFPVWTIQHRIDPQGAVLVTAVDEQSSAWREGLRPEMMITHVGAKRVTSPREFREAVADQAGPVKLRLTLPAGEEPVRTIAPDAS